MEREPRSIGDGLDGLMRSLRGSSRASVGGVFGRWADAVGPTVAAHAAPRKLDGTHLVVEVDEPGWATQLRFLDADIKRRLSAVAGVTVETIEVRVRRS